MLQVYFFSMFLLKVGYSMIFTHISFIHESRWAIRKRFGKCLFVCLFFNKLLTTWLHSFGQFITTSAEVTPNRGLVRESSGATGTLRSPSAHMPNTGCQLHLIRFDPIWPHVAWRCFLPARRKWTTKVKLPVLMSLGSQLFFLCFRTWGKMAWKEHFSKYLTMEWSIESFFYFQLVFHQILRKIELIVRRVFFDPLPSPQTRKFSCFRRKNGTTKRSKISPSS